MKVILVLATVVAVAYAGVGVLDSRRAAEAARLWQRYCTGRSDSGKEGGIYIYCKIAPEGRDESFDHSVALKPRTGSADQVIFVKPPSKKYNHRVTITGQAGGKQQATIYVLPQKDEHNVQIVDNTSFGDQTPQKPHLFFLDESPDGSGRSRTVTPPRRYNKRDSLDTGIAVAEEVVASDGIAPNVEIAPNDGSDIYRTNIN